VIFDLFLWNDRPQCSWKAGFPAPSDSSDCAPAWEVIACRLLGQVHSFLFLVSFTNWQMGSPSLFLGFRKVAAPTFGKCRFRVLYSTGVPAPLLPTCAVFLVVARTVSSISSWLIRSVVPSYSVRSAMDPASNFSTTSWEGAIDCRHLGIPTLPT
jgi:hypothetical protein